MKKSFLILIFILHFKIYSLPKVENIKHGDVKFEKNKDHLNIEIFSKKSILEYKKFNIKKNEKVNFDFKTENPSSSISLNRVTGKEKSNIFGSLSSNGKVFLINPNGILFGKNSIVDTASFLGSTLDIKNEDFLNDKFIFNGKSLSPIENRGKIIAREKGFIAFFADDVKNKGVIQANIGKVFIGSSGKIVLDFVGDDLINFAIDMENIKKENCIAILENKTAKNLINNILNLEDMEIANSISTDEKNIYLTSKKTILNKGTIEVASNEKSSIDIRGDYITNDGKLLVNANENNAGNIYLIASKEINLNDKSIIEAKSLEGNGGNVFIYSLNDGYLKNHKINISAGTKGDAGICLINVKNKLEGGGNFIGNASSTYKMGTFIIDPTNYDINIPISAPSISISGDYNININADVTATTTSVNFISTGSGNITQKASTKVKAETDISMSSNSGNIYARNLQAKGTITLDTPSGDLYIYVDKTYPIDIGFDNNFSKIQNAINAIGTVFNISYLNISSNTYTENISANKNLTFLGNNTVTIDGSLTITNDITFSPLSSNWIITDFTLSSGIVTQNANISILQDFYQSEGTTFTLNDHSLSASLPSFSVGGSFHMDSRDYSNPTIFNRYLGFGTSESPYIVRDIYDVQAVKSVLDAHYKMNNDIDASSTTNWNWDTSLYLGFDPIGFWEAQTPFREEWFSGVFDGYDYKISNLYINRREPGGYKNKGTTIGLFGVTRHSEIKNLGLENVDITGTAIVGSLAGSNGEGGLITNCYATGEVKTGASGYYFIGGLVGWHSKHNYSDPQPVISRSYSHVNVTADGTRGVGGLVGGSLRNSKITNSFSTGNVSNQSTAYYTGGFVGSAQKVVIENCYSTGSVTSAGTDIGSFIGNSNTESTITNCYSTGATSGVTAVGGFIGKNDISAGANIYTNNFWDKDTVGDTLPNIGAGDTGVLGINKTATADMKKQTTFTGWDFIDIWYINENISYPLLLDDYVWIGSSSSNWNDPKNWYPEKPFSTSSKVIINKGGFDPVLSENTKIDSLTIEEGVTFSLNGYFLETVNLFSNSGTLKLFGTESTFFGSINENGTWEYIGNEKESTINLKSINYNNLYINSERNLFVIQNNIYAKNLKIIEGVLSLNKKNPFFGSINSQYLCKDFITTSKFPKNQFIDTAQIFNTYLMLIFGKPESVITDEYYKNFDENIFEK